MREAIRVRHADGLLNREIAVAVGCHHRTVAKVLAVDGLTTNSKRGTPPERVDDEHSRCRICEEVVPNDQFPYVRSIADGRRLSICRKCRYTQGRKAVSGAPARYFADREARMARGERGARGSRKDIPYELPNGYLHGLWEHQAGRCFYTDQQLRMEYAAGRAPDGVSIDRVDPAVGYVVGNVVLCATRINSIKSDVTPEELEAWLPSWHERVLQGLPALVAEVVAIVDDAPRAVSGRRLPSWVVERRARMEAIRSGC